jgi:hypothetical protein
MSAWAAALQLLEACMRPVLPLGRLHCLQVPPRSCAEEHHSSLQLPSVGALLDPAPACASMCDQCQECVTCVVPGPVIPPRWWATSYAVFNVHLNQKRGTTALLFLWW